MFFSQEITDKTNPLLLLENKSALIPTGYSQTIFISMNKTWKWKPSLHFPLKEFWHLFFQKRSPAYHSHSTITPLAAYQWLDSIQHNGYHIQSPSMTLNLIFAGLPLLHTPSWQFVSYEQGLQIIQGRTELIKGDETQGTQQSRNPQDPITEFKLGNYYSFRYGRRERIGNKSALTALELMFSFKYWVEDFFLPKHWDRLLISPPYISYSMTVTYYLHINLYFSFVGGSSLCWGF